MTSHFSKSPHGAELYGKKFCIYPSALYFGPLNGRQMKKAILILSILFTLVACSKQSSDLVAPVQPKTEQYFSQVNRYKDGRTPAVDTVWTLKILDQVMLDTYTRQNGYVYNETSTTLTVGVLWSK